MPPGAVRHSDTSLPHIMCGDRDDLCAAQLQDCRQAPSAAGSATSRPLDCPPPIPQGPSAVDRSLSLCQMPPCACAGALNAARRGQERRAPLFQNGLIRQSLGLRHSQIVRIFRELDEDGDGCISQHEFRTLTLTRWASRCAARARWPRATCSSHHGSRSRTRRSSSRITLRGAARAGTFFLSSSRTDRKRASPIGA